MTDAYSPLVCICVPTYNAGLTIAAALRSILAQTYTNFLVLVVDNCSTDNTAAVVDEFKDARITLHQNETNLGGEGNFNRCIELASGKYMAIYHADDIYEPDIVARQVSFLEQYGQAGAVFTEANLINEHGQSIGSIKTPASLPASLDNLYRFESIFKAVMESSNFLICPSVMVHTEIYQKEIRAWRGELFGSGSDLDVWLRIAQRHALGIIREPLMRYRISGSQWSAKVRTSTDPSPIFKILNHYMTLPGVRQLMTSRDFENYGRLARRDRIGRAVNLFIAGDIAKAQTLSGDVWSVAAFKSAIQTRSGLLALVWGGYLRFLHFFYLHRFGKASLVFIKRVTHR